MIILFEFVFLFSYSFRKKANIYIINIESDKNEKILQNNSEFEK